MRTSIRNSILVAAASVAILAAAGNGRAEAMPFGGPAAIGATAIDTNLLQDVAYGCSRVWRCGPFGCGWRRVCYGYGGPYAYYGGGPSWRHSHWRHHRW
jgi:hypothetical protein